MINVSAERTGNASHNHGRTGVAWNSSNDSMTGLDEWSSWADGNFRHFQATWQWAFLGYAGSLFGFAFDMTHDQRAIFNLVILPFFSLKSPFGMCVCVWCLHGSSFVKDKIGDGGYDGASLSQWDKALVHCHYLIIKWRLCFHGFCLISEEYGFEIGFHIQFVWSKEWT